MTCGPSGPHEKQMKAPACFRPEPMTEMGRGFCIYPQSQGQPCQRAGTAQCSLPERARICLIERSLILLCMGPAREMDAEKDENLEIHDCINMG